MGIAYAWIMRCATPKRAPEIAIYYIPAMCCHFWYHVFSSNAFSRA